MATGGASPLSLSELYDFSKGPRPVHVAALALGFVAVLLLSRVISAIASFLRIKRVLSSIPSAPGGNPILGHVIPMLDCIRHDKGAWDLMVDWLDAKGAIVKYQILGTQGIVVRDPLAMKRIFQTGYKLYEKDLALSYHPFLPILGTGLVTADGPLWQKQRMLMGPALRVDVLDDIIDIAFRATDRLSAKLAKHKGTATPVNIEEEYRLLTLQVRCAGALAPRGAGGVQLDGVHPHMCSTASVLRCHALLLTTTRPPPPSDLHTAGCHALVRMPLTCRLHACMPLMHAGHRRGGA